MRRLAIGALALWGIACGSDEPGSTSSASSTSGDACTPGHTFSCLCTDGSTGEQSCKEDGSGYDACDCSVSSGPGGGSSVASSSASSSSTSSSTSSTNASSSASSSSSGAGGMGGTGGEGGGGAGGGGTGGSGGVAFVSVSFGIQGYDETSVNVPAPTAIAPGDLLMAHVAVDDAMFSQIETPAGWTFIRGDNGNIDGFASALFYRIAAGVEPPSYTFTFTSSLAVIVHVLAYEGVHSVTPIDAQAGQAGSSSSVTAIAPSITTTVEDCMLVALFTNDLGNPPWTPPPGMTERFDAQQVQSGLPVEGADGIQALAGATGTKTATLSGAGPSIGQLIALRPAP